MVSAIRAAKQIGGVAAAVVRGRGYARITLRDKARSLQ